MFALYYRRWIITMSLVPAIDNRGVVVAGDKLIAGVMESMKIQDNDTATVYRRWYDTWDTQGPGGNWFTKRTRSRKSRVWLSLGRLRHYSHGYILEIFPQAVELHLLMSQLLGFRAKLRVLILVRA